MTVIDLSIGFNELDLFCIRYHELNKHVDKFVVVEATHTHRGDPKPTYFADWFRSGSAETKLHNAFDDDRIEIITWDNGADFAPLHKDYSWVRENFQREILGMWAVKNLHPDDLCILSDMDEIPSAQSLEDFLWDINYLEDDAPLHGVWRFKQVLTYLYMNTTAGDWCGSKIFPVGEIANMTNTTKPMTDLVRYRPEHMITGTIEKGGWHFSSIGGIDKVIEKLSAYAHWEIIEQKSKEDLQDSLSRAVDPFHKNPLIVVDCNYLPRYVLDNLEYFTSKGYIYHAD